MKGLAGMFQVQRSSSVPFFPNHKFQSVQALRVLSSSPLLTAVMFNVFQSCLCRYHADADMET